MVEERIPNFTCKTAAFLMSEPQIFGIKGLAGQEEINPITLETFISY
jgi:hypothetical protein